MSHQNTSRPADASGTFALGGDLTINRLGYGAMQLTSQTAHLEKNTQAARITLTDDECDALAAAV